MRVSVCVVPSLLLQIRTNTINPTVVLTAMGRANWSDPAVAQPMLNHIPLGRFAGEFILP